MIQITGNIHDNVRVFNDMTIKKLQSEINCNVIDYFQN